MDNKGHIQQTTESKEMAESKRTTLFVLTEKELDRVLALALHAAVNGPEDIAKSDYMADVINRECAARDAMTTKDSMRHF